MNIMKLEMRTSQALKALAAIEAELRDFVEAEAPLTHDTETDPDADIAPLVQKVAASSIAEIEKLMSELQEVKHFLQSELRGTRT
jgi:hypothetical protein